MKKIKELEVTVKPPTISHSDLQKQCAEHVFKYAQIMEKKQQKNGQYRFNNVVADLSQQVVISNVMLGFVYQRGGIHYIYGAHDKEIIKTLLISGQKSCNYLASLSVKAAKGYTIKYAGNAINNTANVLCALAEFVKMQINEHFQLLSPFKITDNGKFIELAEGLAKNLWSQRDKKTKKWPKDCDHGLVLYALSTWVSACRAAWSYYPDRKTNEYYSYIRREYLFKTCLVYAKNEDDTSLIPMLSISLIYSPDITNYKDKLLPILAKLLLKTRQINDIIKAANFYSSIWSNDSIKTYSKLFERVEGFYAKQLTTIPKTLPELAKTLPNWMDWARFTGHGPIQFAKFSEVKEIPTLPPIKKEKTAKTAKTKAKKPKP